METLNKLMDLYPCIADITVSRSLIKIQVVNIETFRGILETHALNVKQVRESGITDHKFSVVTIPNSCDNGGTIVFHQTSQQSVIKNLLN